MKNFLLAIAVAVGFATTAKADLFSSSKAATVMVTNAEQTSGGSGTIIRSTPSASVVLTNAHVCKLLENGGNVVTTEGRKFPVTKYKVSKQHDLCIAVVAKDLDVNTKLAYDAPDEGENVVVSGHPYLLPHINKPGHVTGKMTISMVADTVTCTKAEYEQYPFLCLFWGMPIIKQYETQVISSLIAGGNSGSGVYDDDGNIVGVVFAGRGRGFTPAIIVPYEYVRGFLKFEARKLKWQRPKTSFKYSEYSSRNTKTNTAVKNGVRLTDLKNTTGLVFPAIYSNDMDSLYQAIKCVTSGSNLCLRK